MKFPLRFTHEIFFTILTCICLSLVCFDTKANEEGYININLRMKGFDKYAEQTLEVLSQAPLFIDEKKFLGDQWHVTINDNSGPKVVLKDASEQIIDIKLTLHDGNIPASIYLLIGNARGKFIHLAKHKTHHDDQYVIVLNADDVKHSFDILEPFDFFVDIFDETQTKYNFKPNDISIALSKYKRGGLNLYSHFKHQEAGAKYRMLLPKGTYWIFLDGEKDDVSEGDESNSIRSSYYFSHKTEGVEKTFELTIY